MRSRILIVEDDDDLREVYVMALGEDHDIMEFGSSQEAVNYYKEDPNFDLIITDQDMPGLTGSELVKEIKKINKKQKIALITGYGFMVKFPPNYRISVFPKPANIKQVVDASLLSLGKTALD